MSTTSSSSSSTSSSLNVTAPPAVPESKPKLPLTEMAKNLWRFDSVFMIGLGGTGSYLIEPLARLIAYRGVQVPEYSLNTAEASAKALEVQSSLTKKIILIDGDMFESSNLNRQNITNSSASSGTSKSQHFLNELHHIGFPMEQMSHYPQYVDQALLFKIINIEACAFPLLVLCVDNHKTRLESLKVFDSLENCIWLSPGNGISEGQVNFVVKYQGHVYGTDPRVLFKDIENPVDFIPGTEPSCLERSLSSPQLIGTNFLAAAVCLNVVQCFYEGIFPTSLILFNALNCMVRPDPFPVPLTESLYERYPDQEQSLEVQTLRRAREENTQPETQSEQTHQPDVPDPDPDPTDPGLSEEELLQNALTVGDRLCSAGVLTQEEINTMLTTIGCSYVQRVYAEELEERGESGRRTDDEDYDDDDDYDDEDMEF